jgi:hypothetical protein
MHVSALLPFYLYECLAICGTGACEIHSVLHQCICRYLTERHAGSRHYWNADPIIGCQIGTKYILFCMSNRTSTSYRCQSCAWPIPSCNLPAGIAFGLSFMQVAA